MVSHRDCDEDFQLPRADESPEDEPSAPQQRGHGAGWLDILVAAGLAAGFSILGTTIYHGKEISRLEQALKTEKAALKTEKETHNQHCADWKAGYDKQKRELEYWGRVNEAASESGGKSDLAFYICAKSGLNDILSGAADKLWMPNNESAMVRNGILGRYLNVTARMVKEGDTLSGIAEEFDVPMREVLRLNKMVGSFGQQGQEYLDQNPNLLWAGRYLFVPQTNLESVAKHEVKKGETLMGIARQALEGKGYDKATIRDMSAEWYERVVLLNRFQSNLDNPNEIKAGSVILLPDSTGVAADYKARMEKWNEDYKKYCEETGAK